MAIGGRYARNFFDGLLLDPDQLEAMKDELDRSPTGIALKNKTHILELLTSSGGCGEVVSTEGSSQHNSQFDAEESSSNAHWSKPDSPNLPMLPGTDWKALHDHESVRTSAIDRLLKLSPTSPRPSYSLSKEDEDVIKAVCTRMIDFVSYRQAADNVSITMIDDLEEHQLSIFNSTFRELRRKPLSGNPPPASSYNSKGTPSESSASKRRTASTDLPSITNTLGHQRTSAPASPIHLPKILTISPPSPSFQLPSLSAQPQRHSPPAPLDTNTISRIGSFPGAIHYRKLLGLPAQIMVSDSSPSDQKLPILHYNVRSRAMSGDGTLPGDPNPLSLPSTSFSNAKPPALFSHSTTASRLRTGGCQDVGSKPTFKDDSWVMYGPLTAYMQRHHASWHQQPFRCAGTEWSHGTSKGVKEAGQSSKVVKVPFSPELQEKMSSLFRLQLDTVRYEAKNPERKKGIGTALVAL
ncbi:hypothetical protein CEUSTIGMA_g10829.t1 [Chlamydomonas eustigma]|uniref:Uncharacterized protein n=1 Tax=Chlamydomonas eustigma TaxID=1157962 RepID=A0A250XK05_9CHLO|nr:hypothetical protein CEUSTIGMA_g10829.t1 [Chlamydomonas eustigma]|eukprot:GAX83404.1 hypothetical protein CEUSTIGMA_g10829.t1 [Chlamydomonas eustigma]